MPKLKTHSGSKKRFNLTKTGKVKMANQAVMKSLTYAYTGRKLKKRDFRSLWITRISAACKMNGMNYSTFMHGLKVAGIEINRKMLAEMAVNDAAAFTQLTEIAKKAEDPFPDYVSSALPNGRALLFVYPGRRGGNPRCAPSVRLSGRSTARGPPHGAAQTSR